VYPFFLFIHKSLSLNHKSKKSGKHCLKIGWIFSDTVKESQIKNDFVKVYQNLFLIQEKDID
jgi:uncharacterized protein (DUF2225 family)